MALHRGIQSAIFYYLSCAPCTGYSYRKKRRKEAQLDRIAKNALEMEQPGLYRHPSPFATNPHWQTEIDLGPAPASGKRKGRDGQKKGRTRTSDENVSNVPSSVNLALTQGDSNDSTWNLRNWQRDDEEYWGSIQPYRSRTSTNGASTISRPLTARTTTTDRSGTSSYYSAQHPPINELHPPIVTRIDTMADAMWMLQPPPPARVMRGSQKPGRDRSDSGSSRPSSRRVANDVSLSRQVSQRIVDEKLRAGLSPEKDSLRVAEVDPSSSSDDLRSKRRRRPPPISVSEDPMPSSRPPLLITPVDTEPDSASPEPFNRQHLSPIPSSTALSERARSRSRNRDPYARTSDNQRPPNGLRRDSSLNALQELVPTDSLLNVQKLTKAPSFEARVELPSSDEYEEMMLLGSGKAGFDSCKDFTTFPQWAAERVRRDVEKRWSVDF